MGKWTSFFVNLFYVVISLPASILNIAVIICAWIQKNKTADTMHYFVISMTLGDLILTSFAIPGTILTRISPFWKNESLCYVENFFGALGTTISGLSLTLLNLDKLIYFKWPLRYRSHMSSTKAKALCAFIWVITTGYISFLYGSHIVVINGSCAASIQPFGISYYYIYVLIFCILPVFSSLLVSLYLFRLLKNRPAITLYEGQNIFRHKIKVKSMIFIFATTFWTSFSLLPHRIHTVMSRLGWFLYFLLELNPNINAIITAVIYLPYRRQIIQWVASIKGLFHRPHVMCRKDEATEITDC